MIKKNLKILVLFFFVINCGYSPIYSNQNKTEIDIILKDVQGDISVNNLIKNQLFKYQNTNAKKKYEVSIISSYDKSILSKSTTGAVTNYRLTLNSIFNVKTKNSSKTINISESLDMKKEGSLFDEQNYEKLIKKDLIKLIIQKLIFEITRME